VNHEIAGQRLRNQRLTHGALRDPAEVVAWLGAVQAQEYPAARWGLALRMRAGTTDAVIQRAVDEGRILRTHVMRPTWHFVTPADIRWMLELTAPHVQRVLSTYCGHFGLDVAKRNRATARFEAALGEAASLTRAELGAALARAGIVSKGVPLALMTISAELDGVICSGPYRGKQLTYALLDRRAPRAPRLSRDEALARLASRFFSSHGPATIRDFVWWSGLSTPDASRAADISGAKPREIDGRTYWTIGRVRDCCAEPGVVQLLPIYDEYLVAYRDREAVPHGPGVVPSKPRPFVTFQHAVVIGGQVAGTWKVRPLARERTVEVFPARRLKGHERRAIVAVTERYARFVEMPVSPSLNSQLGQTIFQK